MDSDDDLYTAIRPDASFVAVPIQASVPITVMVHPAAAYTGIIDICAK